MMRGGIGQTRTVAAAGAQAVKDHARTQNIAQSEGKLEKLQNI